VSKAGLQGYKEAVFLMKNGCFDRMYKILKIFEKLLALSNGNGVK
jgi:hypothetical protein